ncbi:MgtE intracellular domain protein [Streptococcus sanguinis SK330]|uniref:MgtE intracellular domain protein n=1 Tax=Streptococcus sanguinis SK330 TaxID=888813 RepID=F2C6N7_STRSA|nr:MgtE intracellular domain protein [Streptococcus sanguinis SK330]
MEELLNQVLLSQDSEVFNQIFDDYYPIDIALSLEALEDEEGNLLKTFTEMASDDQLVEILKEAEPELQRQIIQSISFKRTSTLFHLMPDDDVVDILGYLSVDLRKQYLSMMKNTSQEYDEKYQSREFESYVGLRSSDSWWSDDDRIHHLK